MVEDVDIDLLQRVLRAKLVDLMMYLIRDPKSLVLLSVVQYRLIDVLLLEFVDDLDLVEVNQCAVGSSAGYACYDVSLDANLHFDELFIHGDSEVKTGLAERRLEHSEFLVDSHVALLDFVEAAEQGEAVEDENTDD